jgi:hypothetical protein
MLPQFCFEVRGRTNEMRREALPKLLRRALPQVLAKGQGTGDRGPAPAHAAARVVQRRPLCS